VRLAMIGLMLRRLKPAQAGSSRLEANRKFATEFLDYYYYRTDTEEVALKLSVSKRILLRMGQRDEFPQRIRYNRKLLRWRL